MFSFLIKKISYGILILSSVILMLSFLFFSFLNTDGKAVYEMTGQNTDQETIDKLKKELNLDLPVYKQVGIYCMKLIPFHINKNSLGFQKPDLGMSYQTNKKVSSIISQTIGSTIILAFASIIFATIVGIILGYLASIKPNSWLDQTILLISSSGMALPSFFAAVLLSWFLGYILHEYTGLNTWGSLFIIDDYTGEKMISFKNLILPSVTLGIRPLSVIAQLTKKNILEVQAMDFIRTAKAKGLSNHTIFIKHVLKNILNPLITAISGWLGGMLAGAVFIEYIYGWKGIGKEIVDGLQKLDYPVVMGCIISITTMFVLLQIVVDIMYSIIDPRVKL